MEKVVIRCLAYRSPPFLCRQHAWKPCRKHSKRSVLREDEGQRCNFASSKKTKRGRQTQKGGRRETTILSINKRKRETDYINVVRARDAEYKGGAM